MKYFILFFIFFNTHAFVSLDYIRVGLSHNEITVKNCAEFEANKNNLFYLGNAYLFNKRKEEHWVNGEIRSKNVLKDPIVLKSDNTFVQSIEKRWEKDRIIYMVLLKVVLIMLLSLFIK